MKRRPKLIPLLCALAVLLCAAAPAVFLMVTDRARFGRVTQAAIPYAAAQPTGSDYYLLCQLVKRNADHTNQVLQKPDYYVGARNTIEEMTASFDLRDQALEMLQNLADEGVLPQPWVDVASDWPYDGSCYTDYNGQNYWLEYPYYTLDSLGFLTVTRFALEEGRLYIVFTLTVDSRTGSPVRIWVSAPEELERPGPEALRAWVRMVGLDSLDDWAIPENTPYQNALYSANGAVLATCTVHSAQVYYDSTDFRRGYISLALTPMTPEELPVILPAA